MCEETLPKIEEDQEDKETPEEVVEWDKENQRLKQNRIANKQYQDFKLYVTVKEEDKLDIEGDPKKDKQMASVAHYIMMHYAKKESIKRKQRKKYKPKAGQYSLETGLKHFGERGDTAISKELKQFNVYDVFEPLYADKLRRSQRL